MSTAEILRVIALISAWQRGDAEAVAILLEEGRPDMLGHLIEFVLMILSQNTDGNPVAFLEWMGAQALTIQANEAKQ